MLIISLIQVYITSTSIIFYLLFRNSLDINEWYDQEEMMKEKGKWL